MHNLVLLGISRPRDLVDFGVKDWHLFEANIRIFHARKILSAAHTLVYGDGHPYSNGMGPDDVSVIKEESIGDDASSINTQSHDVRFLDSVPAMPAGMLPVGPPDAEADAATIDAGVAPTQVGSRGVVAVGGSPRTLVQDGGRELSELAATVAATTTTP